MKTCNRLAALLLSVAALLALCACNAQVAQESPSAAQTAQESPSAAPSAEGYDSQDEMAAAYMKAMYETDVATRLELLLPEYVAQLTQERECQSQEELEEALAPSFQALREEMEDQYGADYAVFAVAEESQALEKTEVDDLRRWYAGHFDLPDQVSDARTVYVLLLVGQEGQEQSVQQEVTMVRLGENWYVDARAHGFD